MTFYKEVELIFPYLKSIRKLKTYLSFDVEIPSGWKIPKKYITEGKVVEQEKNSNDVRLISFVSDFNEEETNLTISNIKGIIEYNKEIEQKQLLFVNKVEELKKIFEKQDLDKLQTLKFELNQFNLDIGDEEQRNTDEVVTERD
jgi:hypothetical protein